MPSQKQIAHAAKERGLPPNSTMDDIAKHDRRPWLSSFIAEHGLLADSSWNDAHDLIDSMLREECATSLGLPKDSNWKDIIIKAGTHSAVVYCYGEVITTNTWVLKRVGLEPGQSVTWSEMMMCASLSAHRSMGMLEENDYPY